MHSDIFSIVIWLSLVPVMSLWFHPCLASWVSPHTFCWFTLYFSLFLAWRSIQQLTVSGMLTMGRITYHSAPFYPCPSPTSLSWLQSNAEQLWAFCPVFGKVDIGWPDDWCRLPFSESTRGLLAAPTCWSSSSIVDDPQNSAGLLKSPITIITHSFCSSSPLGRW